jgi:hypothetical protein
MSKKNETSKEMQERLIGPDYDYGAQIRSPEDLGMSSRGSFSVLADDISGLMAYIKVLITGRGKGSVTGEPLGTKFFLKTRADCTDKRTRKSVKRSIYINNVPDGSIPFISTGAGGIRMTEFLGLVPGLMSNMAQINPLQLLQAFSSTKAPICQAITMETINAKNQKSTDVGFVTNDDINNMNPAWFPGNTKPSTKESFGTMNELRGADYSQMPNDVFIKIYFSSLGLLGLYIFLKMILRKK